MKKLHLLKIALSVLIAVTFCFSVNVFALTSGIYNNEKQEPTIRYNLKDTSIENLSSNVKRLLNKNEKSKSADDTDAKPIKISETETVNDEYAVTYENNDFTMSLQIFPIPIKFKDEDGTMKFKDNSFKESKRSKGFLAARSILLIKVKIGIPLFLQTVKSFIVCASTPFAPSISMTAASAAQRVRYVSSEKS